MRFFYNFRIDSKDISPEMNGDKQDFNLINMRLLDPTLLSAMESGNYDPYFLVTIQNNYNGIVLFSDVPVGYELSDLELTVTVQKPVFLDVPFYRTSVVLTRGVTIAGAHYTLDTSRFTIIKSTWDGNFQTFKCHLIPSSGAAYVFTNTLSGWSQQAYLKASNTDAGDDFGRAVSISGDTLAVGAVSEDSNATGVNGNQADNSDPSSGAAYVFTRSGSTWSQRVYLKASNTDTNDLFGIAVSLSGDTLVVGAQNEGSSAFGVNGNQADNSAPGSGAAYVFKPLHCIFLPLVIR